jgi:hypothetical protein
MCASAPESFLLDPRDVEEDAAVRAAAPGLHLAHDAARDVIARQQLRRALRGLVALRVAPAFFFVGRRLVAVRLRDVVEHEAASFLVQEDPAFAADALGDEDALHARRPDHARRVELDELHVHQLRAGLIRERVAVARAFPAVAGDLVRAARAARRQDDGARVEHLEPPALALVPDDPGGAARPRSAARRR